MRRHEHRKPEYACVPMTDAEHRRQHQEGESGVYALYLRLRNDARVPGIPAPELGQEAKEWFDRQRITTVEAWAWQACKAQLGHESMADVPPSALYRWAEARGVERLLPREYRDCGA